MADHPTGERSRAPDQVVDHICAEVTAAVGHAGSVTELWAERGRILPRALTQLQPTSAKALLSVGADAPVEFSAERHIELGVMADAVEPAQAMFGVPPWRWAPVQQTLQTREGQPVQLCDDPAHLTLLRACVAMPTSGVMVVVVGLGFLARRGRATVATNLHRFGTRVTNLVPVNPNVFRPTSGPGRVIVVLEAV